jgi:TonB family protein
MISLLAALLLQAAAPVPATAPPFLPVRAQPKGSLGSLISNDDYPKAALREEEEGTVGFTLQIGADGLVTKCAVTSSSGSAALDSATCSVLTERARFAPALDRRGKPTVDSLASRIIWRIDRSGPTPPMSPTRGIFTMLAGPSGDPACTQAINFEPAQPLPCESISGPMMVKMAQEAGKDAKQLVVITMTPDGEAELPVPSDDGTQIMLVEARVSAAADGVILECREVRAESMGRAAGRPPPPGVCGQFTPGSHLFNGNAPAPITMDFRIRAYMAVSG